MASAAVHHVGTAPSATFVSGHSFVTHAPSPPLRHRVRRVDRRTWPRCMLHPQKRPVNRTPGERLANRSEDEKEATDTAHLTGSADKVRDLGRAPRRLHRLPSSDTDDGPRQSGRRRSQIRLRFGGQETSAIRRRYGEISCPPKGHVPVHDQHTGALCSGFDTQPAAETCLGVNDDFRTVAFDCIGLRCLSEPPVIGRLPRS